MSVNGAPVMAAIVVAVDVGKNTAALSVTDAAGTGCGAGGVRDDRAGPGRDAGRVASGVAGHGADQGRDGGGRALPPAAAGRRRWPAGWEVLELNPAHVSRAAPGRRAGGGSRPMRSTWRRSPSWCWPATGSPVTGSRGVIGELAAWAAHRTARVATRTATKNQLLGQLDRCFPGLTLALPDVLGTKVGRLVAEHFADPHRLAGAGRGPVRSGSPPPAGCRCAGRSPTGWSRRPATRCRPRTAAVARQVLAADLALLADLDAQIDAAEAELAQLLPRHAVRALDHRARLGCGPGRQLRRRGRRPGPLARSPAALPGLRVCPRRSTSRPGNAATAAISREGSVALRRALIDLGIGLWLQPTRPPGATANGCGPAARRAA